MSQKNDEYCYFADEEKDPDRAAFWWTMAAEQGDAEAMFKLGVYFFSKVEDRLTISANRKANQHKADLIGDQYMAEYWCTKAAKLGHLRAQFILGAYYHVSEHGPKDSVKAVYWYNKAANQGDEDAQFLLGNCYYEGVGVQKDPDKAAYWWSLSAAQGHDEAAIKCENVSNSFLIYHSMNDQHGTLRV